MELTMRNALALTLAAALAACAPAPGSILPTYTSETPYLAWTCENLTMEALRVQTALGVASNAQAQAHAGDVAGVLLLFLPVASLSGQNVAPEIARLRGESEALDRAMQRNRCGQAAPRLVDEVRS